jgi:hypothetical protein
LIGLVVLWLLLTALGIGVLRLPVGLAILGGLIATLLHFAGEMIHQLGHAWAAARTGYPMSGVRFWWMLGQSIYPNDQGNLPARIHIRRALGGPSISVIMAFLSGLLAFALSTTQSVAWWAALFFFLDNLLVFTLGALLPLGFTDGSTLLHYRNKP